MGRREVRSAPAGVEITLWRLELACGHTAFAFPREKRQFYFCYAHDGYSRVVDALAITGHRGRRQRETRRPTAAEF